MLMLLIALPVMLPEFGVAWLAPPVGNYVPGMVLTVLEGLRGPEASRLVGLLSGWILATTALATWLLVRDAA